MTDMTRQPPSPPGPSIACSIPGRIPGLPQRPAAFAPNPYLGPHWQEGAEPEAPESAPDAAAHADDLAAQLGRSLQLSRAGALSLTRLQLAIKCGDRQATMAAMDRLHAVDAEMERLVERLPSPDAQDPAHAEWQAISRHLADQKLSLAFEKLALVSEISGPGMVSHPAPAAARPQGRPGEAAVHPVAPTASHAATHTAAQADSDTAPPLADWPRLPAVEPAEWKSLPAWLMGLLLAVLAMVAVGTAVVTLV